MRIARRENSSQHLNPRTDPFALKLEEKSQLRRQMLVSAIRMVRGGVPSVPTESDASAPFDIVQTASGFDLVSSFEVNGEAVTLKVGNE